MSHQVINDYLAGAIGGSAGLVVGHPFDTTKVQLQTRQLDSPYRNTWQAIQNIRMQGWSHGFFRGLAFPLVSYGVVNSIFFGIYGNTLRLMRKETDKGQASYRDVFVAGCVAGGAQLVVACPVDVVKVILQSQLGRGVVPTTRYFRDASSCLLWTWRHHGVTGCYRALGIMALRDVPTFGSYVLVYETLVRQLAHNVRDTILVALIAGGVAGVAAWTLAMPLDVVKSVLQADVMRASDVIQCCRNLYRARGARAFFAGLQITWLRAFPVNAITFVVYAKSLHHLNYNGARMDVL